MGKQRVVSTVLACAMWAASEGVAVISPRWVSERQGRIIDCATVCVTVWALLVRYSVRGRRGERVVSDEDYHQTEQAITRGAFAAVASAGHRGVRSL